MSFQVETLDAGTAPAYAHLAFPRDRPVLGTLEPQGRAVAVGAHLLGLPAGLALARATANGARAEVLSLMVAAPYRRRGVGTALLQALTAELRRRGCRQARGMYWEGLRGRPVVERVFETCGWQPASPVRLFIFRRPDTRDRWYFEPRALPDGLSLSCWAEVTREEIEALQMQCVSDARYRDARLSLDVAAEPPEGLVLRHQDEIVGWLHLRRLVPDTVLHSGFWVRQDHRQGEAALALLAEAVRWACEAGIVWHWDYVPHDNARLLALVEFYLGPDIVQTCDMLTRVRAL
jgi:GNAT superfamily N-acetyltransferase